MNHIIKGIIIVTVAITSMLIVGATTKIPIMQNSFASLGSTTATTTSPATGTLKVVLNELNSHGDSGSRFTVTVKGNNPQPSSFSLSGLSLQFVKLDPGSFAVSIDSGGIDPEYSGVCKGAINAGQFLICTITFLVSS